MISGYIKVPMFLYIVIKTCLARFKLAKDKSNMIVILSMIISILLLGPVVLILLALSLYKTLINLYLKKIYKKSYIGIMEGIDSICCNQGNCVPAFMIFIECKGGVEELKRIGIKTLERVKAAKHDKVFYSRGEYMGYHYYFKEEIPIEDYITVMDAKETFVDRRKLSEIYMPYNGAPMPCNDRKLVQILICPQPIQSEEFADSKVYCIICRMHHCVGDGKAALDLVSGCFADNAGEMNIQPLSNIKHEKSKMSIQKVKDLLTNVGIKELPFISIDRNPLRGCTLTEEKHSVWFSDSSTVCMDKIRNIKKNIKGASFLDVMNTCLTSSLHDHYKKRSLALPDKVCGGVVLRPDRDNLTAYGSKDFTLINKFSVACFWLPIRGGDKLMSTLRFLISEYETVRTSLDITFTYFLMQYITTLIPSPLMRWVSTTVEVTIGISSLPGIHEIYFDGNKIRDLIAFPPNSPGTGLHIVFQSYKGLLRIASTVDNSVMPLYEDAQQIIDGIIAHLDKLNTLCSSGKTI